MSLIEERRSIAAGRCEATVHHADCPGFGNVLHHVYRKGDTVPEGQTRDDVDNTRWVWNGHTTLGAGGCHQRLHQNIYLAEVLGHINAGHGLFGLGAHLPGRFWSKVDVRTDVECWEWQGACQPSGHGRFNWAGGPELTHRLVMGLRQNDPGLALHHCDNPPCVNPLHLYIGTHADNTRDMMTRGRHVPSIGAANGKSVDVDEIFAIRWHKAHGLGARKIAILLGKSDHGWVHRVMVGDRWPDGPWPDLLNKDDQAEARRLQLTGTPDPF